MSIVSCLIKGHTSLRVEVLSPAACHFPGTREWGVAEGPGAFSDGLNVGGPSRTLRCEPDGQPIWGLGAHFDPRLPTALGAALRLLGTAGVTLKDPVVSGPRRASESHPSP